jgi:hypothetical protein
MGLELLAHDGLVDLLGRVQSNLDIIEDASPAFRMEWCSREGI